MTPSPTARLHGEHGADRQNSFNTGGVEAPVVGRHNSVFATGPDKPGERGLAQPRGRPIGPLSRWFGLAKLEGGRSPVRCGNWCGRWLRACSPGMPSAA